MATKREPLDSPWALESIYYYQFYCCPECDVRVALKQDFIDHAFEYHPDSKFYFPTIMDGSLDDVILPWNSSQTVKTVRKRKSSSISDSMNKTEMKRKIREEEFIEEMKKG